VDSRVIEVDRWEVESVQAEGWIQEVRLDHSLSNWVLLWLRVDPWVGNSIDDSL